jgi:alpha-L-fucosidase
MHSREDCIRMLVCAAVDDGNLLLNVSPMPDGRIEKRQADRMAEIGAWLGRYGQSIYGTRGGPFVAPDEKFRKSTKEGTFYLPVGEWWGGSTCHGNSIFLHILRWPHDVLSLPPLPRKVVGHNVLTGGTAEVRQTAEHLEIEVPEASRDALDTIVELKLDGPAEDITPIQQPTRSLMAQGRISASSFYDNHAQWGPAQATDGDDKTRWSADKTDKLGWLQVDFDIPHEISSVYVKEALGGIGKFALLYRAEKDGPWQTCFEGTTIGQALLENFPPVKACAVRMEILQCSKPPVSIWEFRVFSPLK